MGPSETIGPSSMGVGARRRVGCHRRSAGFTRRDRRGNGLLIIGRLHGRAVRTTGIGPTCRRRAGTVLGIVGRWQRLGFEHDLVQRQRRGSRRRIGGHVAPRGKVRLRRNFLRPLVLGPSANDSRRIGAEHAGHGRASLRVAAENPLAGHVRHVAAGQRLDRALQADLLANAGFQLDTLRRSHVAANHTPAIEDDVGGRPVLVGGIAVELSTQGGTGGSSEEVRQPPPCSEGPAANAGMELISPRTTTRDSCCRFTAIPLLKRGNLGRWSALNSIAIPQQENSQHSLSST